MPSPFHLLRRHRTCNTSHLFVVWQWSPGLAWRRRLEIGTLLRRRWALNALGRQLQRSAMQWAECNNPMHLMVFRIFAIVLPANRMAAGHVIIADLLCHIVMPRHQRCDRRIVLDPRSPLCPRPFDLRAAERMNCMPHGSPAALTAYVHLHV